MTLTLKNKKMKNYLFCSALVVLTINTIAQTVTDVDENIYNTVIIGTQTWMKENLKTTKFNDSASIPFVTEDSAWIALTTLGYCWYNNDIDNKSTYGALYNWYAVSRTTNGDKNICPSGWHVPTDDEWITFNDFLGGSAVAGGKLKETGTSHWKDPNSNATNEYGFTALPGGFRGTDGIYYDLNEWGNWWSSTPYDDYQAWLRWLNYEDGILGRGYYSEPSGISVRCLKDNNTSSTITLNSSEIIIFPNPAYEKIYISPIDNLNGSINIFDIQGKQVINKNIDSNPVDISYLIPGLYILKFVKSDNIIINKFIKE